MRRLLILCVFGVSVLFANEGRASVRVHVTDGYGGAIATAVIFVSSANARTHVVQDQVLRPPYGSYEVEARVPGFSNTTVRIEVTQPEQIVVAGTRLGALEGPVPTCSLMG